MEVHQRGVDSPHPTGPGRKKKTRYGVHTPTGPLLFPVLRKMKMKMKIMPLGLNKRKKKRKEKKRRDRRVDEMKFNPWIELHWTALPDAAGWWCKYVALLPSSCGDYYTWKSWRRPISTGNKGKGIQMASVRRAWVGIHYISSRVGKCSRTTQSLTRLVGRLLTQWRGPSKRRKFLSHFLHFRGS